MRPQPIKNPHTKLTGKLILAVAVMFGFGYALVPLYDVLCELTGLNGKTSGQVAASTIGHTVPDLNRTVTVRFVAGVNNAAPWQFSPNDLVLEVHPGVLYKTSYYAENRTGQALVGQAVPSVAPREASLYFNKTECFCFTRQPFAAQEGRDMVVQFMVDPDLPAHVESLVLSYTFYDVTQS